MSEEKGKWVTLNNGTHVFIADGQTLEQALQKLSVDELKNVATVKLSRQEWARFYGKIGELKSGGYFKKLTHGLYVIPLFKMSDSDTPKLIFSTGNYIKPTVRCVFECADDDELFDILKGYTD